uniref:Uncharacterized protein n=1 Tax=uncultured marine group II/III euryarchaeote AD1000_68_A11 TaxID=1457800 RepID=A0A075FVA5_9EURY|nr:hypothetical protein [uncultured marine group II/III euryarchaeote AD1000_68_A11]
MKYPSVPVTCTRLTSDVAASSASSVTVAMVLSCETATQIADSVVGQTTSDHGCPTPPSQCRLWSLSMTPMPSTRLVTTQAMTEGWQSIPVTSLLPRPWMGCTSAPPSAAALILHSQPSVPPTYAHEPPEFHATEVRPIWPNSRSPPASVTEWSLRAYLSTCPSLPTISAV